MGEVFYQSNIKKTVIILENASIHKSKDFIYNIARGRELDLIIYFFSPYSPELNKIKMLGD